MAESPAHRHHALAARPGARPGLGRAGAAHWWVQRLTSLALVPLTLWFLCAVIRLLGATRDDVVSWMAGPLPIVLLIALVIATFHHLQARAAGGDRGLCARRRLRIGSILLVKGSVAAAGAGLHRRGAAARPLGGKDTDERDHAAFVARLQHRRPHL